MAIVEQYSNSEVSTSVGPGMEPEATTISLEEGKDPIGENRILNPLIDWVEGRYQRSKQARQNDEIRWLTAYRNHRGEYGPDTTFSSEEQSQVFIKVTKTKVLAAVAQIGDVLFAGNKFPLAIEPTPVPESALPDTVHIDLTSDQLPPSTIARPELHGFMADMLKGLEDKVQEGDGKTAKSATWEPNKIAAKKMEKKIHDQLAESDASKHLRSMAFEMALFGTGIMKGPFAVDKEYPKWERSEGEGTVGVYNPVKKVVPKVTNVSIWNFYPDADAHNMSECTGVVERHKMSAYDLRALKKRPMFREESIDEAIRMGFNYHPEHWESILEDAKVGGPPERYEVLEYWGMISREIAEQVAMTLPVSVKGEEEFQINAWVCNGQILRLVLNPYTPINIPYYATPFEVNPYSFFGIGVAENMADTQEIMNGVFRMTIDNMALSGNVILEIDENSLVAGQDTRIFPGRIFRRQAGSPGVSINGINIPNVTQQLLQVYDKARELTDEATSMPSYAHGGTGVTGMGRTASGMSMLMGAADKSVKAIIRNIDDYFLAPCGKALFAFNMQFDYDPDIVGDLDVVAMGTESLMRNEIRSQRLLQFLQTGLANPATAPLVKADYILRELAVSLDLDEDKVVNDPRAAMIQAELIKTMGMAMGVSNIGNAPGTGVQDPTGNGGGTIAPGNAPEPGAQGFTGSGGGANGGQQAAPAQPASQPSA